MRKAIKRFIGKAKKNYGYYKLGRKQEKEDFVRLQRIKNTSPIYRTPEDIEFANSKGNKIKKEE